MDYGLRGRVALVNAASKGIGRAIAEVLAAEGVQLVLSARNGDLLERTATEIAAAHGVAVVSVSADVARADAAAMLVGTATSRFGRLDILINNSGGPPTGTFADFDDAAWQHAFDLLLLNVVRMVRAAVPHLRTSGHGRIVNPRRRWPRARAALSGLTARAWIYATSSTPLVCLVKVAYEEPTDVARARGPAVDAAYRNLMQALLASGHACSIAAHDPVLLDQAHTLIQDHNLTGRSSPILS